MKTVANRDTLIQNIKDAMQWYDHLNKTLQAKKKWYHEFLWFTGFTGVMAGLHRTEFRLEYLETMLLQCSKNCTLEIELCSWETELVYKHPTLEEVMK